MKVALEIRSLKKSGFYNGLDEYPDLQTIYLRAQQAAADSDVDEIKDIADNDPDSQRARNRIDARKWIASKRNPAIYGDRIDLNVNQVIDIGTALAEARKRAMLPVSDQPKLIEVQTLQITSTNSHSASDIKSVVLPEKRDASDLDPKDIFS